MLTQITPDIQRLTLRFPGGMGDVNSYLLAGKHGYTIVDTGLYSKEAIQTWESIFASGIKIEKVVLTHTHQDHIGLARWMQKRLNVPIIVSDLGHTEIQEFRTQDVLSRLQNLLAKHGAQELIEPTPVPDNFTYIYDFEPDDVFTDQQSIRLGDREFKTIWTPGHAPDHFCFYQPETEIMLTGDHILQDISPVIGLWMGKEINPLQDYYRSLQMMMDYQAVQGLPGHGRVIETLHARTNKIKTRHDQRLAQVLAIIQEGTKTAYHVSVLVYGKRTMQVTLSSFMATLTRLLYLEAEQAIERDEQNGQVVFRQAK